MADDTLPEEGSTDPDHRATATEAPTMRNTGPMSSKKFLALMFAMVTNKILLAVGLFVLKDNVDAGTVWMWWWMIALTITDGFLSVGGILGIAYVDKYVRVAQIAAQGPPNGGSNGPV